MDGSVVQHNAGADIITDGISLGVVQVPPNGQPIVMMSERPTTGGYTKLAVVVSADIPLLAQCAPGGDDRIHFRQTTVEAAQSRYRSLIKGSHEIERIEDDESGLIGF